jgi:uncharacterized lipoprotein YajG
MKRILFAIIAALMLASCGVSAGTDTENGEKIAQFTFLDMAFGVVVKVYEIKDTKGNAYILAVSEDGVAVCPIKE